ncbi:MAG: hypothetical protein LBE70_02635, partial [Nitrososphaerota archaeon]|nr:hypothetical protein [Nitrososphaerota archaeon]
MFSKVELEYLKSPEKFDTAYACVLRHRINVKRGQLCEAMLLLQNAGLNITENSNSITEFSNVQQNQITTNHALIN